MVRMHVSTNPTADVERKPTVAASCPEPKSPTISVEELRLENHVRRARQDQSRTLCTENIAKERPHVVLASTLQPLLAS